jgi:hypothetical protein
MNRCPVLRQGSDDVHGKLGAIPKLHQLNAHRRTVEEAHMDTEPEPLIFTPDFIHSLTASGAAFERQEIARIAKLTGAGVLREQLESAARAWPIEKRTALIGRIRSTVPTESWAAIAELLVYDGLRKEFDDVQVEPPLPALDGKTPDFVASAGTLVIEVATVFEQANVPAQMVIETLNGLVSDSKIMNLAIRNPSDVSNPQLSEIRQGVGKILSAYDGVHPLAPFEFVAPDDVAVTGLLYKGNREHAVVGGVVAGYLTSPGEPGYIAAIRKNVLTVKARKYGRLARSGSTRLVIALYCRNDWLDELDFSEILFGDEETLVASDGRTQTLRRNPFFRKNRNTSIAAVLIRSAPLDPRWILVLNPFASRPLGDVQSRLERAFSTYTANSASALDAGFR